MPGAKILTGSSYIYFAAASVRVLKRSNPTISIFWQEKAEAKTLVNAYDFPAVCREVALKRAKLRKMPIAERRSGWLSSQSSGGQVQDPRVRQALNYAYNFRGTRNKDLSSGSITVSTVSLSGTETRPRPNLPQGQELGHPRILAGQDSGKRLHYPYEKSVWGKPIKGMSGQQCAQSGEAVSLFRHGRSPHCRATRWS